jgi:uncharacterized membrane protein
VRLASARREYENVENRIFLVTKGLKTKDTIKNYKSGFSGFIKHIIKHSNLRSLRDTKPTAIENYIIEYVEYMRRKKLSRSTIQVNCEGVFHFFDMNGIIINKSKV